jgi:hypothetical protein
VPHLLTACSLICRPADKSPLFGTPYLSVSG